MAALLSATTVRALNAPVETSLRQLLIEYGYAEGDSILPGLAKLSEVFGHHCLQSTPPLGVGDLDDIRILAPTSGPSIEAVMKEIGRGETSEAEFKSSLLVDANKRAHNPTLSPKDCVSEKVIRSSLKSIAGFANSGGGVLYIGVGPDNAICGLQDDFSAVGGSADYDAWDLHFRNLIVSRFNEGPILNQYVQTRPYRTSDDRCFVQARVAGRSRLTFLKSDGVWELFMRSGTQTNSIPYADIEQHFSLTRYY